MLSLLFKLLVGSCIFITFPLFGDINILIIGSEKDTSEHRSITGDSQAFSPSQIKEELKKILEGTKLGKVNVVLEDRHKTQEGNVAYNLISWFYWPYPANIETESRWPNLRGEKGTKWDYVVLIGDSYTIEKMPGLYSHGVAKIAEEVAKGSAKTVLLMPWPGKASKSTVAHYKEVIYRTGRSGGFMVAPAALAWEAAGKPVGDTHPGNDGAYMAAASIYSRIWKKNAKDSSYSYNEKLADTVHKTVINNIGKKHYSGKFNFQSPFKVFSNQSRIIAPIKSGGGSSTEVDFVGRTVDAIHRAGAQSGKGSRYTIGRYTGANPQRGKDFRNRGSRSFGYVYHSEGNNADKALANIVGWEMFLGNVMIKESNDYRLIPRRILLGSLLQFDPEMKVVGGGHVYGPQATSVATYIYTLISNRCPVGPQPNEITADWNAQKVGYELAWQVANCQTRAPGFKVLPSKNERHTLDAKISENMKICFMFKPKNPVTVKISTGNLSAVEFSPQSLTFTPDNYNTAQTVSFKASESAAPGTKVNIQFKTVSEDEVYNDLFDTWQYKVNTHPLANDLQATAYSTKMKAIILTGSDIDGEALTFIVDKQPKNGSLVISSKGVAAYTANKGFTGTDSFSFRTHDGSSYSKPATVNVSVTTPDLYETNLIDNPSGELSPFTDHNWKEIKGTWLQKENAVDGIFTFAVREGKEAELVQNINVSAYSAAIRAGKQVFNISGLIDKSNDTVYALVEFLDSTQKVLLSCDSKELMSNKKSRSALKLFESTQLAPPQTAAIRLRLISKTERGKSNGGRFDALKITAVKPD